MTTSRLIRSALPLSLMILLSACGGGANTQPAPGEKKPAEGQVVKGDGADNC